MVVPSPGRGERFQLFLYMISEKGAQRFSDEALKTLAMAVAVAVLSSREGTFGEGIAALILFFEVNNRSIADLGVDWSLGRRLSAVRGRGIWRLGDIRTGSSKSSCYQDGHCNRNVYELVASVDDGLQPKCIGSWDAFVVWLLLMPRWRSVTFQTLAHFLIQWAAYVQ